jgi:hypothetical protein
MSNIAGDRQQSTPRARSASTGEDVVGRKRNVLDAGADQTSPRQRRC